jgi:hypothetical protein
MRGARVERCCDDAQRRSTRVFGLGFFADDSRADRSSAGSGSSCSNDKTRACGDCDRAPAAYCNARPNCHACAHHCLRNRRSGCAQSIDCSASRQPRPRCDPSGWWLDVGGTAVLGQLGRHSARWRSNPRGREVRKCSSANAAPFDTNAGNQPRHCGGADCSARHRPRAGSADRCLPRGQRPLC